MKKIVSVVCVASTLAVVACAGEDSPAVDVDTLEQAIIHGSYDTDPANNAVVALSGSTGSCTGTLFKVEGNTGWILTAAHCVPTSRVHFGANSRSPALTVNVQSSQIYVDRRYDGDDEALGMNYDMAIVRISSNQLSNFTPIPLIEADDGLAVGTQVRSFGYGMTEGYESGYNDERKTIELPVNRLTDDHIFYRQSATIGGICAGDSGGPVVHGTGAARRLVGVHSYVYNPSGAEPCFGTSASVRVSHRRDFIDAVLNGTTLPPRTACQVCRDGADNTAVCRAKQTTCESDSACAGLVSCLRNARTDSAVNSCVSRFADGLGPLIDMQECVCTDACATECGDTSACEDVAKCGVAFATSPTRTACVNEHCCAEADAAAADGLGYQCFQNSRLAGCDDNAPYQAYLSCARAAGCVAGSNSSSSGTTDPEPQPEPTEEPEPTEDPGTDGEPTGADPSEGSGGCSSSCSSAAQSSHPSWQLGVIAGVLGLMLRRRRGPRA